MICKECQNLKSIIKQKNLDPLFQWINKGCDCKKCIDYNNIFNLIYDDNFEIVLKNDSFKKINLTETMKYKINNEINNIHLQKYLFKIIKKL